MTTTIESNPYRWPYDGDLRPANTALLVMDMQIDFCAPGGYADKMGHDIRLARAPIAPLLRLIAALRHWGCTLIHTREGHRRDLSDLQANKRWRSRQTGSGGVGIGDKGPLGRVLVRDEPGWEITPELAPLAGEPIIDKPGKGSFYGTDLEILLHMRGIRNLVLAGIHTDVGVHTTMREANDRGFECLLLSDCSAGTDAANHHAVLRMIRMQGGVFGAAAESAALITAVESQPRPWADSPWQPTNFGAP
jgi:nicotinamidase-related amidase